MSELLLHLQLQARRQPGAVAVCSGAGCVRYGRLYSDVQRLADRLRQLRVGSLGLYLDNGIEWIALDLAALAAGIRVVPLPRFFSAAQLEHAVASGAVDFIACAGQLPRAIAGSGSALPLYRYCRLQPLAPSAAGAPPPAGGKLSFTSGSTGRPRGIDLPLELIEQSCESIRRVIPADRIDRHLSILPYATLLENIAGVYVPLTLGKTVLAEPGAALGLTPDLDIDPAGLGRAFNRLRPDSLILTPQLLQLICSLAEAGAVDPSCLAFVAVGGARVGATLLERADAAGIPVYEGYGLTEFASVATLNTPQHRRVGSVGKALPGVEVSLAEDGEICLAAEFGAGRRYRVETGDYGSIDADGFVYVHGRKSNLIVLANGRNVAPEWVETELTASPLIEQAFVYSERGAALAALVYAAAAVTESEIDAAIERVNRSLPRYARVAEWRRLPFRFSRDNRMLTANGRLRRDRIKRLLPAPSAVPRQAIRITDGDLSSLCHQEINQ